MEDGDDGGAYKAADAVFGSTRQSIIFFKCHSHRCTRYNNTVIIDKSQESIHGGTLCKQCMICAT